MDSISPQDIYARHLASRRGYPLWTPEPSMSLPDVYRQLGLRIGDVGVVVPEDGSFDVFFNICLPQDHSLHRHAGVPKNFTLVDLDDRDISIFPEAESAGRVISTPSIARIGGRPSNENEARPAPLNYEFALTSKEGALLILPEGAERYHLRNQRPFLEEAIHHAIDWYEFAEERLGRIISHDSLYLITGFYKACSWSLASYQQPSGIGGARAQFRVAQVGIGNVSRSYTWETTSALDWRVGPSDQYYNGTPNQSVFIQGFKIAVRSSILGMKRIEVKEDIPSVRPHRVTFYSSLRRSNIGSRSSSNRASAPAANNSRTTDADSQANTQEDSFESDSSALDDVDEDIVVQHVPQVPNPFHPSDIINQYLLRSHPSAMIAITHDDQWATLLERELIRPDELVQEGLVEDLIRDMSSVCREEAVYLRGITSPSGYDAESDASSSSEVIDAEGASTSHTMMNRDTEVEPPETPSEQSPRSDVIVTSPRSASNALMSRRPSPKSGFFPATPRPPKLALPDEEPRAGPSRPTTRADMRPPKTSIRVASSSRANPTPGQPAVPLKSILKGNRNTKTYDSYENEGEILAAKKVARSQYNIPNVLPPGSHLVPMKQPAFDLHWQLLPYDQRRSKQLLRFDIAFPVDEIVFQGPNRRTRLSDAELDKLAANGTMTKMLITFEHGAFSWEVDVKNPRGIRCRDVFEAIYKTFNKQLILEEQRLVRNRKAVDDAFRLRCRLVQGRTEVERSYGWKRVDILLHHTIFLGLTPKSGGDWVLNLGSPPQIPGLS